MPENGVKCKNFNNKKCKRIQIPNMLKISRIKNTKNVRKKLQTKHATLSKKMQNPMNAKKTKNAKKKAKEKRKECKQLQTIEENCLTLLKLIKKRRTKLKNLNPHASISTTKAHFKKKEDNQYLTNPLQRHLSQIITCGQC